MRRKFKEKIRPNSSSRVYIAYFHLACSLLVFSFFPSLTRVSAFRFIAYVCAHVYRTIDDGSPIERSKENSIEIRFVRYLHILKLGVRNEEETRISPFREIFFGFIPIGLNETKRNETAVFVSRSAGKKGRLVLMACSMRVSEKQEAINKSR